jgi:hypothetical protein
MLVLHGLVGRPLAFLAAWVAYACVRTVGSVFATTILAGDFLTNVESLHLSLFAFPVETLAAHGTQVPEHTAELVTVGTEVDSYAAEHWC